MKGDEKGEMVTLSFRATVDVVEALQELIAEVPLSVAGRHSVAIRQAILDARAKLRLLK